MLKKKNGKLNILGRFSKRTAVYLLVLSMVLPFVIPVLSGKVTVMEAEAAGTLKLSAAKALAIANSEKIEALDLQIDAKMAAKQSAIRSLSEKERNMKTFRWSPLLNFAFPTKADEAEAFEFAYKPTQLQYEIDTIKHKIEDEKLKENEKVSGMYIDIITSIAEITFLNQRIAALEEAMKKNKARIAEGTATQAQVDQQQKKLDGYKNSLTSEESKLQRAKEKLGKEIGFDITVGYKFEDIFVSTSIARDNIEYLENYALSRDQNVYEAQQNLELANLALMTNYNLMKKQYSGDINMISSYVDQALDGSKIDKRAFKKAYDAFLKKIDAPWQGSYKILFFKFPKEWFKGAIDGIRFVEDDPYVLYSSTLEYESAVKEYNNAVSDLNSAIEEGYDNLMETRKGYKTAVRELNALRRQLIYDEVLNALGQLSLEEYDTELGEYEQARSAVKEALALYSRTLYEYDRTTCGGASAYFVEETIATKTGYAGLGTPSDYGTGLDDGLSLMSPIIKKGATYSIRAIVDSEEFMLYIDIPEDFEYNVTHFELWSDGRRIGERTAKGEAIRHLRLTLDDVNSVFIRLYNGDTFIDDCSINPDISYGPLNMTVGYEAPEQRSEKIVGSYTVEENEDSEMIKLRFTFEQAGVEKNFDTKSVVAFYNLSAERNLYLFSNDLVPVDEPFSYLGFIKGDLGQLTVRMFAEDGEYIGGAYFGTQTNTLYADTEITVADMQEIAARQILAEEKAETLKKELEKMQDLLDAATAVNGQETDSGTMTYYKKRIAELETEISEIASAVTSEEINKLITSNPTAVNKKVEELKGEDSEDDQQEEKQEEEIKARNAILKEEAIKMILEEKKQTRIKALTTTIDADNKKLFALNRELEDLKGSTNADDKKRAEEIKKQIESLEAEVKAAQDKLKVAEAAELSKDDVTEEEIEKILLEKGQQIYSKSAEKLSDAMLYGSEPGQWATAYLESNGFDVTDENMRLVVQCADSIDTYEKNIARKAQLQKEIEETKAKIEKIKAEGGTANNTLVKQLEDIVAAYEKEVKASDKSIKKSDPGKEIKLKTLREEKAGLEKDRTDKEKELGAEVAYKFSTYEDYKKRLDDEYDAAELAEKLLKDAKATRKTQLESFISVTKTDYDDKLKAYKDEYDEAKEDYDYITTNTAFKKVYEDYVLKNKYPDESDAFMSMLVNQMYAIKARYDRAKEVYDDFKVKYNMIYGNEASKKAETDLEKQILAWKEELEGLDAAYSSKLTAAASAVTKAKNAVDKAKTVWDTSVPVKKDLEKDIKNIDKRLNEIDALIAEYY